MKTINGSVYRPIRCTAGTPYWGKFWFDTPYGQKELACENCDFLECVHDFCYCNKYDQILTEINEYGVKRLKICMDQTGLSYTANVIKFSPNTPEISSLQKLNTKIEELEKRVKILEGMAHPRSAGEIIFGPGPQRYVEKTKPESKALIKPLQSEEIREKMKEELQEMKRRFGKDAK